MKKLQLFMLVPFLTVSCMKETCPANSGRDAASAQFKFYLYDEPARTHLGPASESAVPVLWDADDQLWVRSSSQAAGTAGYLFATSAADISEDGRTAVFTGPALQSGNLVAAYPYSKVSSSSDNSAILLNVPKTQSFAEDSFAKGTGLMVACWKGNSARFTNIAGLLRLKINYGEKISRIVVKDNNKDFALWGSCTVSINSDNEISDISWENKAADRNEISLDCTSLPAGAGCRSYYFSIPAGAFANGLLCTVYGAGGQAIRTFGTDKNLTVGRGRILSMAEVDPEALIFSGGKGTSDSPYKIASAEDMAELSALLAGDRTGEFNSKWYRQICDINMSGVTINAIGPSSSKPFKGHFDGGGHTISKLAPVNNYACALFGYLENAEVKDIVIDGYTNKGTSDKEATVAGYAKKSRVSGCKVKGDIKFVNCCSGGVAGYINNTVVDCCSFEGKIYNNARVDFEGVTQCSVQGGIVGLMKEGSTVSNCSYKGQLSCKGECLGGIVGQQQGGIVQNCNILEGSGITGDNYTVGGITGNLKEGGIIDNCTVQGAISIWYKNAGGIAGRVFNGSISNCVVGSYSNVRSTSDRVGGIAGYINCGGDEPIDVTINGCVVYSNVTGAFSVGGIAGEVNPTRAADKVNIVNCAYVGGDIVGNGFYESGSGDKWAMCGGIAGWVRMGSSGATVNILNSFSDPAVIRSENVDTKKLSIGGIIGDQSGSTCTVNVEGCYSTLGKGRIVSNGNVAVPSSYTNYGAILGTTQKIAFDHVYYVNGTSMCGSTGTVDKKNDCTAYSVYYMTTQGAMLGKLNEYVGSYSGPFTLKSWVAAKNGYPIFSGMTADITTDKNKPLRMSVIGDSLTSFDGYTPYQYGSHYPAGDVTCVSSTYWYILAYELMSNCVMDTNLAWTGTAVMNVTDTKYKDKTWFGKDFNTRYINNGGVGSPDIVVINGGANDYSHNIGYLYGDVPMRNAHRPSDAQMKKVYDKADACTTLAQAKSLPDQTLAEAYVKLCRMIMVQYPDVKILVLIHDTLSEGIVEMLRHISDHYSCCRYVDLYAVNGYNDLGWNLEYLAKGYQPNFPKHDFDWSDTSKEHYTSHGDHYNAKAMRNIANKIYDEQGKWLECGTYVNKAEASISDFNNKNGQW